MELERALPHVRAHRDKLFVLKIGGACLARPALVRNFAHQAAAVATLGARVVVVHGAGPQTDALQRSFGDEPRKVAGRRVTTPQALRALRLATAGALNGELAAALEREGVRAVGVCAGTGSILVARRRPATVVDGDLVDFGAVGDVIASDPAPLHALLEAGIVPVVCPPAGDGAGGFLNVNADVAAAHLAIALRAEKLVLLTDAAGVLTDPDDPTSPTSTLCAAELEQLDEEGALRGGMRVKATAARTALNAGVANVHVVSGLAPEALLGELYTTQGTGTWITLERQRAPTPSVAEAVT